MSSAEQAGNNEVPPKTDDAAPSRSRSLRRSLVRSHHASYDSPLRHHERRTTGSRRIEVKETLDARSKYTNSQDDGTAEHFINQYLIREELGRGSFGAVYLAVDQYGREYAVKEFSKARLRKRAQSHFIRNPRANVAAPAPTPAAAQGFNEPLHRNPHEAAAAGLEPTADADPLHLIRHEIAVMKKLQHHNLVSLFEVLDDPREDSLYMVMEVCKRGVVMKVGLNARATPYDNETCRHWFRDLLLGIEYLHAQGIAHRDIKPDNCLLTGGGVLKIVDFGVSEMFEKSEEMYTAKSAGSPAFLPPELCVAGHGDISGRAADIWSMGVTLYCLKYGRIPFEKGSMLELYEAIRTEDVDLSGETDGDFVDLMHRILEKDPDKRIRMPQLREHPWVTKGGVDPLLPEEENTALIVPRPTDEEVSRAITKSMRHVLALVKAVQQFKKLLEHTQEKRIESILGADVDARIVQPPEAMDEEEEKRFPGTPGGRGGEQGVAFEGRRSYPFNPNKRAMPFSPPPPRDGGMGVEGAETDADADADGEESVEKLQAQHILREITEERAKASAGLPLGLPLRQTQRQRERQGQREEMNLTFLNVGPSNYDGDASVDYFNNPARPIADDTTHASPPTFRSPDALDPEPPTTPRTPDNPPASSPSNFALSESPSAADFDIYEQAYRTEIERIRLAAPKPAPTVYLTRRVENEPGSSALLQRAHDEGAVVSAESNRERGRTVSEGVGMGGMGMGIGAWAQRARTQVGEGERRATGVGERFRSVLQKIRDGGV